MPILYKYTTAQTAATILATRSLRWSSPLLFNDPFDVRRDFELPFTNAEYADAIAGRIMQYVHGEVEPRSPTYRALALVLRGALSRGIPEAVVTEDLRSSLAMTIIPAEITRQELRRVWAERVPNMRIVCFSSDAESPSMWAHYAADLSGVVLGFESSDERDSPWLLAEPVQYQVRPPTLPGADSWARAMLGEESIVWEEFLREYYFVKSMDWAPEREYRVPSDKKQSEDGLFSDWTFAAEDLREIRLGPKTDPSLAKVIRELAAARYPHARVMAAVLDNSRLRVSAV